MWSKCITCTEYSNGLNTFKYHVKSLKVFWIRFFFFIFQGFWSSSILNRKVCYPHIGCFSSKYPFINAKGILPSSPDAIGITFMHYTRKNPNQEQILKPYQSQTITSSNFVGSRRTIFITHGFTDTVKSGWALQMKDALLKKVGWQYWYTILIKQSFIDPSSYFFFNLLSFF